MSDEVARRIPGSKYIVLDQGGHFLPETRSGDYNTLLDDFLGDLDLQTSTDTELKRSAS
jgi:aminoacrylate hydrolase